MTYASVVSRESGRIAFLIATLNEMDTLTDDVVNVYINAYTTEKLYYRTDPEWGEAINGTVCVIIHTLYGLKSNANGWHTALYHTLNEKIGFEFSLADNNV